MFIRCKFPIFRYKKFLEIRTHRTNENRLHLSCDLRANVNQPLSRNNCNPLVFVINYLRCKFMRARILIKQIGLCVMFQFLQFAFSPIAAGYRFIPDCWLKLLERILISFRLKLTPKRWNLNYHIPREEKLLCIGNWFKYYRTLYHRLLSFFLLSYSIWYNYIIIIICYNILYYNIIKNMI